MGIGDEIMAAGEARRLHKSNGLPVMIVGRDGRPRWSEAWDGIPYIIKRPGGRPASRMLNCGGARPYIASKTAERWTWRSYKPLPAEIVLTDAEREFAEPYRSMVMIEPNVKSIGHDNKDWGWQRWQELVKAMPETRFVQCASDRLSPTLHRVSWMTTPTFRHAMAVLSVCRAFVGSEGGLMHAAAALGVPAVIVYGGFISPAVTGYSQNRNLFTGTGLGCGMRMGCEHCRKAMNAISVDEVAANLKELL